MSDKKIKCWSCAEDVSFDSIASNDGDCPECNAEIDMYCLAEQLQRQNDELQDRIVKLEVAASMDMRDLEQYGDLRMDRLREYFGNPTGQKRLTQSLQHIEAAAVDAFICKVVGVFGLADVPPEQIFELNRMLNATAREMWKQQSTNDGSDGDE